MIERPPTPYQITPKAIIGHSCRSLSPSSPTMLDMDVMDDGAGRPSRWTTLRAMRVLRWLAAGAG